ncbi:MAG TPA: hypothetical protein VKT81_01310 [Bryobacteraceae bacterium]|nr:hypothetical protein [Bryobacteraceae bacterium]
MQDSSALTTIMFMSAGVLLTPIIFVAGALVVVGHYKPSRRMQRAGWIVAAVWLAPAMVWLYYLQSFIEQDQYRTLSRPEVVYGVPLPAGTQISYRRWAKRLQWANFQTPQTIQGVEYINQLDFCNQRPCSGTLASDQEIEGIPCRARSAIKFSPETGRLFECTLARDITRDSHRFSAGTVIRIGPGGKPLTNH